jgi:hypothetical protein
MLSLQKDHVAVHIRDILTGSAVLFLSQITFTYTEEGPSTPCVQRRQVPYCNKEMLNVIFRPDLWILLVTLWIALPVRSDLCNVEVCKKLKQPELAFSYPYPVSCV